MKSLKLALLYGFLLWLIPFLVAFMIFPLREAGDPFFETIMPVTLTIVVVIFAIPYFRKLDSGYLNEAVKLGLLWFIISVFIDLLMFMWGPMKMSFWNYMKDIGFTYLIYPVVTIGFGYINSKSGEAA